MLRPTITRSRLVAPKARLRIPALLLCAIAALLVGCDDPEPPEDAGSTDAPLRDRQTAFRVRADFDAGLNSDQGWAAAIDQPATVTADRPFRLRLETASGDQPDPRRYRLQMRRNGGDWQPLLAEDFPYPEKAVQLTPDMPAGGASDRIWQFQQGDAAQMEQASEDGQGYWRIDTGERDLLALARRAVQWQPEEFAAELRLPDDPRAQAGLVFDFRDEGDFFAVELIDTETLRIVHFIDGAATVLAEHGIELEPGRWIELKTIVDEDEITIELASEPGAEELVFNHQLPMPLSSPRLGVYMSAGSVAEFRSFEFEAEARTPRSSIVSSARYEHGAPTEDILPVSELPFTGGAGVGLAVETPPWTADGGHAEWSFPIVIRRFADEAALNESGDRFDYRLLQADGEPLPAETIASVQLEVPGGHLGGTFVETPMRLGPWQASNGDLYFIMEPSETWNRLMTVKSSDMGASWREVDGGNRPETGDLEGFGSVLVDDRIHMLHQTSDDVWYHAFNTSDHPEAPDVWAILDERVASPPEPPTQVADIAVRSDGSVVAVYGGPKEIRLRIRSPQGQWGEERLIASPDAVLSGPTIVSGRDDLVHLAYTAGDGSAWYRRIRPDGELTEAFRFTSDLATGSEDIGAILPLLYVAETDSPVIVYRGSDGRLRERRLASNGAWSEPVVISERTVVQNAVDSDQVGADAVADDETIHLLFIEAGTGNLFHASGVDGDWGEAEPVVTGAEVQWVRGTIIDLPNGGRAYGFVYDAGSNGGSGMNKFKRVPLREP